VVQLRDEERQSADAREAAPIASKRASRPLPDGSSLCAWREGAVASSRHPDESGLRACEVPGERRLD
jgi:hypothetical protein